MPEPLRLAHCDDIVLLRCGSLHLSRDIYQRYLEGLDKVTLLRCEDRVNILPMNVLPAASGGYLLRRRNPRGDRVIDAPDFFRAQGFAEEPAALFDARWNEELFGLTLALARSPKALTSSRPRIWSLGFGPL